MQLSLRSDARAFLLAFVKVETIISTYQAMGYLWGMENNKEMTHTEESWTWSYGAEFLPAIGSYGTKICTLAAVGKKEGKIYPESEANAKRIVACVNALAGIDTDRIYTLPTLLDEGSKAIIEVERLKQQVEALRTERDKLIEQLRTVEAIEILKEFRSTCENEDNRNLIERVIEKLLK